MTGSRSYLDHASASPLRPVALDAMLPYLRDHPGDPGRLHHEGRTTRVAVEQAREQVAALLGARPREVVFTSSGTEAVNAAVWGALARAGGDGHVVTTAVEHSAVTASLERAGVPTTVVGVDAVGRFDADEVLDAVGGSTVLVSVQAANHEVGTLQPAAEVAAGARERGVLVHVDAAAAAGHARLSFRDLGADLCSVSAHKLGGPKGIGALLVRRGLRVPPFLVGGAQERARRAGLEDVAGIVGFGAACDHLAADDHLEVEAARQHALVESAARVVGEGVTRLGDPHDRVPQILCLDVEGVEAEPVLLGLDQHGIAAHSGSSCASELLEPSPVLEAMGVDATRSLRVSVGWSTTGAEVDHFVAVLPTVLERLRALRPGDRSGS